MKVSQSERARRWWVDDLSNTIQIADTVIGVARWVVSVKVTGWGLQSTPWFTPASNREVDLERRRSRHGRHGNGPE